MDEKKLDLSKKYFTILRGIPVVVEILHVDTSISASGNYPGDAIVRVKQVLSGDLPSKEILDSTDWSAFINNLELLAQDMFDIGEKVMTNFNNPMLITAYEPLTNRVVCESVTNPKDRQRYAYKVSEVRKHEEMVEIRVGYQYLVNDTSTKVIVTRHPSFEKSVILVALNGERPGKHIAILERHDKYVFARELKEAGINKLNKL
jgi:hypothetical protein